MDGLFYSRPVRCLLFTGITSPQETSRREQSQRCGWSRLRLKRKSTHHDVSWSEEVLSWKRGVSGGKQKFSIVAAVRQFCCLHTWRNAIRQSCKRLPLQVPSLNHAHTRARAHAHRQRHEFAAVENCTLSFFHSLPLARSIPLYIFLKVSTHFQQCLHFVLKNISFHNWFIIFL